MFFQTVYRLFALFFQEIGRIVSSIQDAYFCTRTDFVLPALVDIFIIVIIPGVLPPVIGLPIALFRLMDHFIPYGLWPAGQGKITMKHEVYDPIIGYKTKKFSYLVSRTFWGDYLVPVQQRWEVTDELHPAGFYKSRLVAVNEETFDLPPIVEKAVRRKLKQKQRLFSIRDAVALLLLSLLIRFLYYDWRLLVGFVFNTLFNSTHFILLLIKPKKNIFINIFLIILSIWLTGLHSLLFTDSYADWAIRIAVGLTGVTRNLLWVCCLGILMCVYYTYWNFIVWIKGAVNFIHYYSTVCLFLSPILIFFFSNQAYYLISTVYSSINHPDLFRIHDILNEVPRKNFRKLNNTYIKQETRGGWAIRDKVFFPKVEGFLKDVDSRIRNNLKEMKNLLNLPEQLSYTEANYVRYSKLDEIINKSDFEEFKPIFNLTEEQRAKLRRDAQYQKFVKEMPGYVNVVGETNSSWKQKPLRNVLANLPKNVFDYVYNTTYLCDKEYQILSTSRYTKTEEECTYDWTTRLDEVYELVKPWVENSRLTSFEKVLKDYVFKYNLGFGAQFKGRALKRSKIFAKFGGAIADRTGLKKYFIDKVIPNLNNFAQIAEVFMKEEIQPMLKWPKCRTILGSNFFFHLPALMVGSEPNHRARWQDTPICVGMPLTGRYLKPIFTEVLSCYKRVAGDMTAYDSSLPSPLLDLMRDIRKRGFEKHENKEAIHSFLDTFYETLKHDPMHIKDGGLLVEKGRGLATGYPYTSYDNSFTFQAVLYVAIKDVLPHLSVDDYKKKFLIRDYADDNFICWREKLVKPDGTEFEFSDIQQSLLKYNIKLKCENENPETGLPDDKLLSFLGNNYRHPTEEERKEYGLDLVIYHDERRLLNKFQMNFKARSPLRQLERCSGYLLNCAHLPHAYQIIREEVEEIVRKHPELKKSVHYRNASLTMPEVIRKWYSPLKKHEIKLLQFIHADFQFQGENDAMFNHWSLYDYVCYWEELVAQIPLALSGIGMNYIGAFNYTYLNRFNLTRFIASLCIHYQTEISGVTPYLQRLHLDFIDIEGIFKDHLVVTEINAIIKEASGWTQDHRLAYTGGTRNALKIFHIVDYFIPGMPVLNVFRALTSLFNLSLSRIASLNFLLTSEVLDYNEYTIFNPIRAFVFTLLLPFIHHNIKTDISKNFLQDIVDELDVGFLDLVDYNLGAIANLIKYSTIEEVKKEVDQKMIFDKVIETMLKTGKKGKGRTKKHPLITGRTGFGKSTKFLWRMLKHKNINKVICIIPKRVAVLSILRYALKCGINAGAWTEGSPKTHGNLIYTTLDAFMLRYDSIDENTWICIDEAHFDLNGYGDGVQFLGSVSKFNNIAFMTATPNDYIKDTSYDVFESLKDQLGEGSAASLKVYGPFPVNWSDYMRICRQEVKKVTHDKTLIFVNTLNQQRKLLKAGPFRKTYILNSKAGDPFLDPEFEKASLYITTSICDCSITIPGITKVITHDLIADSNNEGTAIDIYTTDIQTLKQRAGRAGRDCPGEAFLYHISDKSSPKPQRSQLKKYEDTKQLLTNQTYYESLTAEDKQYYRLNKGLLGPLSVEEFLNSLDSESVNQKLSTEEIQPRFQLQDSDFSCKMSHDMFMQVRQGLKVRDLRLNDPGDRFSLWKVNDLIKIYDRANSNDFIQVRIKQVKLFNNLSKAIRDDLQGLTPNKLFNETYSMFKSFPGYEKNSKVFGCLVFCFELT